MAQKIYFDESGYTGNNLLDPAQRHFAYASVASDDDEAKEFVSYLLKKYHIQGGELKGKNLVRFSKGRKAIDEILKRYHDRIKVSISEKKFALACKFYEYIFEPCYSESNSVFYDVGFHRFIANILYVEFVARGAGAEAIFAEFEELMRTMDVSKLGSLFASSDHADNSPILLQIREFARARADDIHAELEGLVGISTGKWILDLTGTSLFTLLANWGLEHDMMIAVCDPSKPIRENSGILNAMVGRKERTVFSDVFGERHPITFNLAEPVLFADSKVNHGIQLADAIAAAAVYVFSGSDGGEARQWREILAPVSFYGSVIPDLDELKLSELRAQRNAVILMELHDRATKGRSLIEGMPQFVRIVGRALQFNPIDFTQSAAR